MRFFLLSISKPLTASPPTRQSTPSPTPRFGGPQARSLLLPLVARRGAAPLDVALLRRPESECLVRYVLGDRRTACGVGAVADPHRGDEGVVAADADVVAHLGAVLVATVVVGDDRARADVAAVADRGVADVRQVGHLAVGPDDAGLDLDVGADLRALAEHGARPQEREGPHRGALADHGAGRLRADHGRALPHL